jgi:3-methyladenine DNA glycosylase AlkC
MKEHAFQLINQDHHQAIRELIEDLPGKDPSAVGKDLTALIQGIWQDIPPRRRISAGRYSIIKALSEVLYPRMRLAGIEILSAAERLYSDRNLEPFTRSLGVGLSALYGLESEDQLEPVLLLFQAAAGDGDWMVRECASGLVRKLVRAYPGQMKGWYLGLVRAEDPNLRRFVSESLRPVAENRWMHKDPDYALEIIRELFRESDPYPRTSVGNSLSDWMRVNQELTWPIVSQLAASGDPNAYWIAYRACRNLVKKQPLQVLETLGVEEYSYKDRVYRKADFVQKG